MLKKKSDIIGILITGLCAVHCAATPVLFTVLPVIGSASSSDHGHSHDTWWWRGLDIVFLLVGFFAIRFSTRHTTKRFMIVLFWSAWVFLAVGLVLQRMHHPIGSMLMYGSSGLLILTHLVNYLITTSKNWKPQVNGQFE